MCVYGMSFSHVPIMIYHNHVCENTGTNTVVPTSTCVYAYMHVCSFDKIRIIIIIISGIITIIIINAILVLAVIIVVSIVTYI